MTIPCTSLNHRASALLAGAVLALALPAAAQTSTSPYWRFSYTGFLDKDSNIFDPAARLEGSFRGSDANGDGVLELGELENFYWHDFYNYLEYPGGGCGYARCELKSFSYELGSGKLFFSEEWGYSDEAVWSTSRTTVGLSHTSYTEMGYQPPYRVYQTTWLWTDQTRFAISPPPVDEPPVLALLPAGLLVAGLLRRRASVRRAAR